ncbi:MAG: cytochrome b [Parvibaculum sp.]|nr:cytochrome b [Parvibaculum sp.]
MSQSDTFSGGSKAFHWVAAVLVLLMLYGGFNIARETATWHFGFGLIVLVVMVFWLGWRMSKPRPALPPMPRWQEIAAKSVHHLLMLCVTLQPIFGLMMVTTSKRDPVAFGVIPLKIVQNDTINGIGHVLHGINGRLLLALVLIHVAAALYHHFVLKDNVLKRMLPFGKG